MKFCLECDNMLYPKEDVGKKQLIMSCRICKKEYEADDPKICTNQIIATSTGDALQRVNKDYIQDLTLPRGAPDDACQKCGNQETVFFTPSDEVLELIFMCKDPKCGNKWKQDTGKAKAKN